MCGVESFNFLGSVRDVRGSNFNFPGFLLCHAAYGALVPRPGTEPRPWQ